MNRKTAKHAKHVIRISRPTRLRSRHAELTDREVRFADSVFLRLVLVQNEVQDAAYEHRWFKKGTARTMTIVGSSLDVALLNNGLRPVVNSRR